jgi:hypothetical protein
MRNLRPRPRAGLVLALAVAALVAGGPPAAAAATGGIAGSPAQAAGVITPVTPCPSLAGRDFSHVPGAPGTVTSATVVTEVPYTTPVAYCDVKGVIAPQTRFELKLPVSTWHGQYLQEGCSALCGFVPLQDLPDAGLTCPAADNGELALAADDMGHTGSPADGSWGRDSLRLRVVYGLTSEHSLAQLSRAVITAYYGRPAAYTYYDGCSTGGREALMLAQRYPHDFSGIIAGAPAGNLAPLALFNAWLVRSNTAPDGRQILPAEKIPALHAAVIRACGNAQGIIRDPRHCGFDPASLQCPAATDAPSCLTPAQVQVVRKAYRGPTDPQGRSLYNGGEPYGSEPGWTSEFVEPAADQAAPGDSPAAVLALTSLKNLAFIPNPPDSFTLADVRFTGGEFRALNRLGDAIYNANNPDLRAFAAAGGKLIMYHGWADQSIPPWSTVDYYAAAERTMGGFAASQSFSRLYLIPGAYHCLFAPDGTSATIPDFLSPLISWVQDGIPPGTIEADTYSFAENKIILRQAVRPDDALAPVTPAAGSLNGHYDYIGSYRPGAQDGA